MIFDFDGPTAQSLGSLAYRECVDANEIAILGQASDAFLRRAWILRGDPLVLAEIERREALS